MYDMDAVLRVKSYATGKPQQRGDLKRFLVEPASRSMILAFIRMGGESRPWGIVHGRPGQGPRVNYVDEPRDDNKVYGMLLEFAPALLSHLGHPDYDRGNNQGNCQVWLPNPSHVEMLHFMAFLLSRQSLRGLDDAQHSVLHSLGKACVWLFQEYRRPGQTTVMVCSDVLRDAYVFPAEPIRQHHLGFLLSWIQTRGSMHARMKAAAKAETLSISVSLDPIKEIGIEKLLSMIRPPRVQKNGDQLRPLTSEIGKELAGELERRYELVSQCLKVLGKDHRKINPGVKNLREDTSYHLEHFRKNGGEYFHPDASTRSLSVALEYHGFEKNRDKYLRALVVHDKYLQAGLMLRGDAFKGKVINNDVKKIGRKMIVTWIIQGATYTPLRLDEGSKVMLCRCDGWKSNTASGVIRSIREIGNKKEYSVEITVQKKEAAKDKYMRARVVFMSDIFIPYKDKIRERLFGKDGPGCWLTHHDARTKHEQGNAESV